MKKIITMMVVAVAAAVCVQAAEVSAYVDFASAYVFRGVTLNNGLVMQPGAEISGFPMGEEYGSLAVGIWGNYDIDPIDAQGADFQEIDYYLSYALPIELLDVSVGYTEYTYPELLDASGAPVNNDKELNLTVGSELGTNGLYVALSMNYGVDGYMQNSGYYEGSLGYDTDLTDALSASAAVTVAYLTAGGPIQQSGVESGFHNATASAGLSYALSENWSLSGSVTYIQQLDDEVLLDDQQEVHLVGMVGVACDF